MSKRSWQGKSIRATITLPRNLYRECLDLMGRHGYGQNFSSFIQEAARNQRRRLLRGEKVEAESNGTV